MFLVKYIFPYDFYDMRTFVLEKSLRQFLIYTY